MAYLHSSAGLAGAILVFRQRALGDLARLRQVCHTPIGYLIDEQGVIAADVAGGAEPILALVSGGAAPTDRKEAMPMR